jgi:type 1 glutamine amidotransferase
VEATEDGGAFSDAGLAGYRAVIFLNTTGDVLDAEQQAAFERYIRAGGGFVGVHAAADTEYGWRFYLRLVGATFRSHGAVQEGLLRVEDRGHPASESLPDPWRVWDEWYDFRGSPRSRAHVIVSLDETSISDGSMGGDHPIAWYRDVEGGRSFYTARGHTPESFGEPELREHLLGGIRWAAGLAEATPGTPLPDASGLGLAVLDEAVDRGMELEVLPDGGVLFAERGGALKLWRPETQRSEVVARLAVQDSDEDGLLGLALDPGFAQNGWLYLFYSPPDAAEQRVSRFSLGASGLDMGSSAGAVAAYLGRGRPFETDVVYTCT